MDNVTGKTRQSHYTATVKIKLLNILLIIFENTIPVADEDLQIRGKDGGGGWGESSVWSKNKGGRDPGPLPGSATEFHLKEFPFRFAFAWIYLLSNCLFSD